jgi:hypothetical protein
MKTFFLIAIFQLFITMILASESCKLVVEGAYGKTETEVVPGQCKKIPHGSKVRTVKLDGTSNGGYFKVYQKSAKCRGSSSDTKESMERETFFSAHSVRVTSC